MLNSLQRPEVFAEKGQAEKSDRVSEKDIREHVIPAIPQSLVVGRSLCAGQSDDHVALAHGMTEKPEMAVCQLSVSESQCLLKPAYSVAYTENRYHDEEESQKVRGRFGRQHASPAYCRRQPKTMNIKSHSIFSINTDLPI